MLCNDAQECINEINAYFSSEVSGYPFVVNIDDKFVINDAISKMQADSSKEVVRVSDFCKDSDTLPDVNSLLSKVSSIGNYFVLGLSQYHMLQNERALRQMLSKILQLSVKEHTVFVMCGCANILKNYICNDLRLDHRVAIMQGSDCVLPGISIVKSKDECFGTDACNGIKELLFLLENHSYSGDSPIITVITHFDKAVFSDSMFSVSELGGVYNAITLKYIDISASTEKEWGNDEQWSDLFSKLQEHGSLSSVINSLLGSLSNFSSHIDEMMEDAQSMDAWYLWLSMKVYGTKENSYLSIAVSKSKSPAELVELVFMELLHHKHTDSNFNTLYKERKRLVERLPENIVLTQKYCDHVGQYEQDAVYYLTDLSYKEKLKFLKCLSAYDYAKDEILDIAKLAYPELYLYLQDFAFTEANTPIPSKDSALYHLLTKYFRDYRFQKVTNRIYPEFLDTVNAYAIDRPYNKLLPRSSVMSDIKKTNTQLHFFDALGVEYLPYIIAKCECYGLQPAVHVAHCELPSITKNNLDFKKYFSFEMNSDGQIKLPGTKDLDELKHHSKEVDYTKCREPIHLFMELEIIDRELRKIREMLSNYEKVLIVSDHGASRLAVLNQSESESYNIGTHGEHSGRCCETDINPNMAEVAYENGYAVFANYDRFKGSRAANVEVHGGATLEETVVPIIEITKKPEKSEIYFVNSFIEFHNKEVVTLIVYTNLLITDPRLVIKTLSDTPYECSAIIDSNHIKFQIPEIRRSGVFSADLYDGGTVIARNMEFTVKKAISTSRDFF